MNPARSLAAPRARTTPALRAVRIALAALVVAASAQIVVPLPFTPVPFTLQPLAVLVVGGLLGAADGAAALLLYLALGAMGLPVFAGGGSGLLRLVGPTGGYLLAFPIAAAVAGGLTATDRTGTPAIWRVLLACVLGMLVIHAGGVAQLALLGGGPAQAFRYGFLPFFTGDLVKVGLAGAVILLARPKLRPPA